MDTAYGYGNPHPLKTAENKVQKTIQNRYLNPLVRDERDFEEGGITKKAALDLRGYSSKKTEKR